MTSKKIILNKKRLIFSKLFEETIEDNKLVVLDAGARGDLEEPWKYLKPDLLKIIGFEPDKKECQRLNALYSNRTYIPSALWSEKTDLAIHVTDMPFCSSVYPPNLDKIKKYDEIHWKQRKTVTVATYPATTIDTESADRKLKIDFLKIDTQGSEFNILTGSSQALKKDIFAVLAETWTSEIYKGQPLAYDVMRLMQEKGFALFDIHIAAAWKRNGGYDLEGKRQIIGLDLLFFKEDIPSGYFTELSKLVKAAAITEAYGFPDYALELINRFAPKDTPLFKIISELIEKNSKKRGNSILKRFKRKGEHIIGITRHDYPSLHS